MASSSLQVRCIGSSTAIGSGLYGETASSLAVISDGKPLLLLGVGSGVVKSCCRLLGGVPGIALLPSMRLSDICDLQVYIQHEASFGRHVKVYAPNDVLDRAIALLDDDIVTEVREFVEFLQVDVNVPTALDESHYVVLRNAVACPPESRQTMYNVTVFDPMQRPAVTYVVGQPEKDTDGACASSLSVIVKIWKGISVEGALEAMGCRGSKVYAVGFVSNHPPAGLDAPVALLRCGDVFVVPGSTSTQRPVSPPRHYAAPANATSPAELGWLSKAETVHYAEDNMEQPDRSRRSGRLYTPTDARGIGRRAPEHTEEARTTSRARSPATSTTPKRTLRRAWAAQNRAPSATSAPPKKLYVFNNEMRDDYPAIVMMAPGMTLQALRAKVGTVLGIRPMGLLYTVDQGAIHSVDELMHGQEVVATKHAGAPFDLAHLPSRMKFNTPAAAAGNIVPLL